MFVEGYKHVGVKNPVWVCGEITKMGMCAAQPTATLAFHNQTKSAFYFESMRLRGVDE